MSNVDTDPTPEQGRPRPSSACSGELAGMPARDPFDFTAKEHLFGNVRLIEKLLPEVEPPSVRARLARFVEGALSWESLIRDDDAEAVTS